MLFDIKSSLSLLLPIWVFFHRPFKKYVPLLFGVFHKCVKTEFQNTPSFRSVMTGACTKYQNLFLQFLHVYNTEATHMFPILHRKRPIILHCRFQISYLFCDNSWACIDNDAKYSIRLFSPDHKQNDKFLSSVAFSINVVNWNSKYTHL